MVGSVAIEGGSAKSAGSASTQGSANSAASVYAQNSASTVGSASTQGSASAQGSASTDNAASAALTGQFNSYRSIEGEQRDGLQGCFLHHEYYPAEILKSPALRWAVEAIAPRSRQNNCHRSKKVT